MKRTSGDGIDARGETEWNKQEGNRCRLPRWPIWGITTRTAISFHDALEFPDGQIVLLTLLFEAQEATVLQLPVQPATPTEAEAQKRVAHVG